MRLRLLVACFAVLFAAPAYGDQYLVQTGTDSTLSIVILVRHAEKNPHPAGGDAGVNMKGLLRARKLARVLGPFTVRAVYASQYGRAELTAALVAEGIGDSVRTYDANHLDALAKRVRAEGHGLTVLVVGHADTIGPTIEALTGEALGRNEPAPYDGMWVLTLRDGGGYEPLRLRYGAKDEP